MKRKAGKGRRKPRLRIAAALAACAVLLAPVQAGAFDPTKLGGEARDAYEKLNELIHGSERSQIIGQVSETIKQSAAMLTRNLDIQSGMVMAMGDCSEQDVVAEQTLVGYFQNTAVSYVDLIKALSGVAEKQSKLKTAILVDRDKNQRMIEKAGERLVETAKNLAIVQNRIEMAASFDPSDTEPDCGTGMRAIGAQESSRFTRNHEEKQREHTDTEWRAGKTAKDWAEADAMRKRRLLKELPEKVENWSDLIFPAEGVYPDKKSEQAGILLAETLGRPVIPPKLAPGDEGTTAGAKVLAETTLWNLQTQGAVEAMQFNVALHAADPALVSPVERMVQEAGLGSGVAPVKKTGTQGPGYSRLQFLEVSALRTLSPNWLQDVHDSTAVENKRRELHLKAARLETLFSRMEVLARRVGVHVALAGSMAEQGRDESADPRETQQAPGS